MLSKDEQWLLDEKYGGQTSDAFLTDCRRLQNGEPLAYVIGQIPFLNAAIYLDSHPLIPRPETEFWVEKAIEEIKSNQYKARPCTSSNSLRILDLCAGSGCIGIAAAQSLPEAFVDFAEFYTSHHATIEKNITVNEIEKNRTRIFGGDLFETVENQYDVIFSNPPYIDSKLDRVAKSVKEYEPHSALYGGKNGMELIERIITEALKYLKANGLLYIEHEPEQSAEIKEIADKNGFTAITHKDQYGIDRYSILARL